MRILLANTTIGRKDDPGIHNVVVPAWRRNFELVKQPDTQIVSRFNNWGCEGMSGTFNDAIWLMNANAVLFSGLHAEEEGFDAIIITCFDDPMLYPLRQLVKIPVVSFGEASMTMATMMGDKFGLVTASEHNPYRCREQIERIGLSNRLANVRPLGLPEEKLFRGFLDAGPVVERFIEVGRRLIADGADVLIPGCGLISPTLRLARGMEDAYPNGLTEIDGVPVLDVLSVSIKTAETMCALKNAGSPYISHYSKYELPSEEMLKSGKLCLEDPRQSFWDVEF